MRKLFLLCFLISCCCIELQAQFLERHNFIYKSNSYDIFIHKAGTALAGKVKFLENENFATEKNLFDSPAGGLFFAISASIVDSNCSPLGLFITNGSTKRAINSEKGAGNFYMDPNGVFASDSAGKISILQSGLFTSGAGYSSAIQTGPMLLLDGTINYLFNPDSKNKYMRCAAGVYNEKGDEYVIFIRSKNPVSFYEIAQVLKEKYNCSNAINLESGDNCSFHLPTIPLQFKDAVTSCRYIMIEL